MRNGPSASAAYGVPLCPKCHTRLNFRPSQTADIDAAGFESYRFDCQECGSSLVGIVDPLDDALLISECPTQGHDSSQQNPDYDFDQLARKLGRNDPTEWRWKPRANDNGRVKPAMHANLFLQFALGAFIVAATLFILFFG
jgi:hypothetical protein